jgi:signal transduction histidine kinase
MLTTWPKWCSITSMRRNLLENAERHGAGEMPSAQLSIHAATVVLAVEDCGPGVISSERERIFEPFYRPPGHREDRDRGVGLGLALVRQIAEHHGGRAWYEPREGRGSRFLVELPRSAPEPS